MKGNLLLRRFLFSGVEVVTTLSGAPVNPESKKDQTKRNKTNNQFARQDLEIATRSDIMLVQ